MSYRLGITICISLALCTANICFSQKIIIGARAELHVYTGYNLPIGPKQLADDLCLLTNMKSSLALEGRYMTYLLPRFGLGANIGYAEFIGDSQESNFLYNGTRLNILTVGPALAYRIGAPGKKVSLFFSASPGLSRIKILTDRESSINGNPLVDPLIVTSQRFSLGTHVGLNYALSHSIGLSIAGGYQYTQSNSKIFADKSYSFINLRMGVFCRLFKDRRYKYSEI
jgi:Outer membrane protein beta-barrel domain